MPWNKRAAHAVALAGAVIGFGLVAINSASAAKSGPAVTLTQVTFTASPNLGNAYCEVTWHLTVTGVSGTKPWGAVSTISPDDLGDPAGVFVGDFTHADDGVAETITDTINGFQLNNGGSHSVQVMLYNAKNQLAATSAAVSADSSC